MGIYPTLITPIKDIKDPGVDRTTEHARLAIFVRAVCAVMCGADDWLEIEAWGNDKLEWLRQCVGRPNGIPSHDTFGRVFSRIAIGEGWTITDPSHLPAFRTRQH